MGNTVVWLAILGVFDDGMNYFHIRKAAKFVGQCYFEELIRQGQLIDLREPAESGAQLASCTPSLVEVDLAALSKDKPIFAL